MPEPSVDEGTSNKSPNTSTTLKSSAHVKEPNHFGVVARHRRNGVSKNRSLALERATSIRISSRRPIPDRTEGLLPFRTPVPDFPLDQFGILCHCDLPD